MIDIVFTRADGSEHRVRKVSPVPTRRGAEEYERQIRQALLDGSHGKKETPTLAEFQEDFMASYVKAHNKPQEIDAKRRILDKHLIPAWGPWRLSAINKAASDRYIAKKLDEGYAPKSIYNHLTVLGTLLAEAAERGLLDAAPKIEKPTCPKPEFDFLTFEESQALLDAAKGRWYPLVLLALRAGPRIGEIRALYQNDVDPKASRVTLRRSLYGRQPMPTKNGKERSVDLSPATLEALEGAKHRRGLVLFSRDDGEPFGKEYLRVVLHGVCEKAGLRTVGWHTLRHTFASQLVMRGEPIRVVQELMGHSTIEMTMRYAHLSPEAKRSAIMSLETPARPLGGNGNRLDAANAAKRS